MRKIIKIFGLYKGDKFIDVGTARELAERRNVKVRTIRYLITPAYAKKIKKRDNPDDALVAVTFWERM